MLPACPRHRSTGRHLRKPDFTTEAGSRQNPYHSVHEAHMVLVMHDLTGTWRLVEWTFTVNGSRPTRPWGGNPSGLLTYTEDGRMSATLMSLGRPAAPTRTLSGAPASIRAAAAGGYLNYAGGYSFDGDDVLHHIELSLMPNWVGTTERRRIDWVPGDGGSDLVLSTPPTLTDGGRTAVNRLRWTKLDPPENRGSEAIPTDSSTDR